jgi:hypothetical protein
MPLQTTLSRTAGAALAAGTDALGTVLHRTKPLHPEGRLQHATLTRLGTARAVGSPLLDEAGELPALVRLSRGVGLPGLLPDIPGLALRVDLDGWPVDILLASTGLGPVSRYVLVPRRSTLSGALTTLLPYRSERGPLVIGALPESDRSYRLVWSTGTSDWLVFARLDLGAQVEDDTRISFDPIVNLVPGLQQYPWVRTLREPAYWVARRRSHRTTPGPVRPQPPQPA